MAGDAIAAAILLALKLRRRWHFEAIAAPWLWVHHESAVEADVHRPARMSMQGGSKCGSAHLAVMARRRWVATLSEKIVEHGGMLRCIGS
eukprot:7380845-Prymnesium_polylepis.2